MNISLEYKPDVGIVYDGITISWGMSRTRVREILKGEYEILDQEFGSISSRRDIYKKLKGQPVFIFLNYDNKDDFSEFEIHNGIELLIFDQRISFEMKIWEAWEILDKVSQVKNSIDVGEIIYIDLKLVLSSGGAMGGEEEDYQLSYVYCAKDISHLLD